MKKIFLIIVSPLLLLMFVFGFLRYVFTGSPATIEHAFDIIESLLK